MTDPLVSQHAADIEISEINIRKLEILGAQDSLSPLLDCFWLAIKSKRQQIHAVCLHKSERDLGHHVHPVHEKG